MADELGQQGTLAVVPPAVLEARLQQADQAHAAAEDAATKPQQPDTQQLPAYIRSQFEIFRNHRNTISGWNDRLLNALRCFNGQYSASVLSEISKFGGSQVYARLIAQKCRGASSLLRDVYLSTDRPWGLNPPADPNVDPEIIQKINQLVMLEAQQMAQNGQQVNPKDTLDRRRELTEAARQAAMHKAKEQATIAEDKIEEILREGSFYHALAEFLVDLPIFPFAVIKGPVVKVVPKIVWPPNGGRPTVQYKPRLYWYRVSPFDLWFTPGVADIEYANVIEKHRITRADLNDMLDLPGFDTAAVRRVLDQYGRGGLYDNWDSTDSERAVLESRENPAWNRSATITMMEFNGNVQGRQLADYGITTPDELRDYHVQAWCIGNECIKAQLSPSPRQRHPYFMTSFEKVPGTPVGNGLTDILADIQEVANATLRSLVNNMSMSSGPQVVIKDERLAPNEDGEDMWPWKRWHTRADPTANNADNKPIDFFQPDSHAQEMLAVYNAMSQLADDISAIPKYVQGGNPGSGAGRTASGLAMLMGNSSKVLQSVSANIDRDVLEGALIQLFDLILLTDTTGLLTGEEEVTVLGVNVAIQKETLRQRQLEFLQVTANPMDQQIVGLKGRAAILRNVSQTIGLPGEEIVPTEKELQQQQAQQQQQAAQQPIIQAVQKGVVGGVTLGAQAIVSEILQTHVPEQIQAGTAITPPGLGGGPPSPPPGGPPQMQQAAAQAQGSQPTPFQQGGPQTNAVGAGQGPTHGSPKPTAGPA